MNTSNTISKIGAVFYIVWALLASSGRLFGIPAWSVIGFVNGARTSIPRCMEPLVLFDHFHFRGCDVELAEQRLGLYWINFATVGIADTGFIFFVLVPGYTRVWPSVLGPVFWVLAMIFSTVALLTRTKGATTELYGRQHRT